QPFQAVLLQVDLAGHSKWATDPNVKAPAYARTDFAIALTEALKRVSFEKLLWLGDGGIFFRQYQDNMENADRVCDAADKTFRVFNGWKRKAGGNLQLRVSATYIPNVIAHRDAGNWFSS